jgi:hypothetical protein
MCLLLTRCTTTPSMIASRIQNRLLTENTFCSFLFVCILHTLACFVLICSVTDIFLMNLHFILHGQFWRVFAAIFLKSYEDGGISFHSTFVLYVFSDFFFPSRGFFFGLFFQLDLILSPFYSFSSTKYFFT